MIEFNLDKNLNKLPLKFKTEKAKGLKVHLVGVGGVAMASLAGLLIEKGYQVSGSDEDLYPPMSDVLAKLNIKIYKGYGLEALDKNTDLVIIGNVVTKKFEVLETIKKLQLPYLSMPECLKELFMGETKNIVIAGCHGKTTSTAMAVKLWNEGGLKPGFLIGGASLDEENPWKIAENNYFIIEGDEYDTAFFNKVPKFIHYRPNTVILTSIEFDHADIYNNLEEVKQAYISLLKLIPKNSLLIANGDDPIIQEISQHCQAKTQFYGFEKENHWLITELKEKNKNFSQTFSLTGPNNFQEEINLKHLGQYNLMNAAGVIAAYISNNLPKKDIKPAFENFKGMKRRQEVLYNKELCLIDDFAHHPTAVEKTLQALKKAFPKRRLLAAFEARSNTSRRSIFQNQYAQSFKMADLVFLRETNQPEKAPQGDRLNNAQLIKDIGPKAKLFKTGLEIKEEILKTYQLGDIIVIMSNGAFDNLAHKLKDYFLSKK